MNQSAQSPTSVYPLEPQPSRKTKLAVLGGGPSALTALIHLTDDPQLRAQYDITIYQMGWRLGGKGASGRGQYGRIEEHGLHVLFGFYENFFAMIRRCYEELNRPAEHPLATWRDAFHPHNFGVVEDYFKDRWYPWALEFPSNRSVPGSGGALLTSSDYLSMLIQSLINLTAGWRALRTINRHSSVFNPQGHNARARQDTDPLIRFALRQLERGLRIAQRSELQAERRDALLLRILERFRRDVWPIIRRLAENSETAYRLWMGIDFFLAVLKGVISDGVLLPGGFNRIDDYDFRDWLAQHGAHPRTLTTPYARTIYDAAFSYADGDPKQQQIAAGAALRALLRMGFTYKGSPYYKMQAGMGDVVFTPLYLILRQRGVKFKFFHKVDALHLSGDQSSIAGVSLTQQVRLKSGRDDDYQPLLTVQDLECWPAEPLYDQIENADSIKGINLESYYDRLPAGTGDSLTLVAGEDYDKLLYAIPIGAVPYLCQELVDHNPRWEAMVQHVKSVQTLSFQLWFKRDLTELGWTLPEPLLSLYVEPLNTWADMSQVLKREAWPASLQARDIGYYTGPQPGPDFAPDPRDPANADFEINEYQKAKQAALVFMRNSLTQLLPNAVNPEIPPQVDWNLLIDANNQKGEARFDSQYWHSNCGPSERCTLALPGATRYRIKADETDYDNLIITGDWINNGLYVACMEGAITSGILAARAISGRHFPVIGEELNEM